MKVIIQRVAQANVSIDNKVLSDIANGLCLLVGLSSEDTEKNADTIVSKILNIKVFEDETGKRWAKSVVDCEFEILSISQFTLYATLKGRKPDFHKSMEGDKSKTLYSYFVSKLKSSYKSEKIKEGVFGAYCHVNIVNDGPVTITLEA